jgi:hypothetical protein
MLTKNYKNTNIFFVLLFFSIPAFSAQGHIYLGGSLGGSMAILNKNMPIISYSSGTLITDAYPLNNIRNSTAIFSINSGYEFVGANWKPAVALGFGIYSNLDDYTYKGQLIETAEGDLSDTLYNYSYTIKSSRVMAEVKLIWTFNKLSPFVDFGIGAAWNKMNGYSETATTSTGYTALPPFQSNTNTNIAYQAGFGLSTAFNFAVSKANFLQERISLGYRYVNLGTTSFGTRGIDYPYHLNTGLLKTSDVYLAYTHLF